MALKFGTEIRTPAMQAGLATTSALYFWTIEVQKKSQISLRVPPPAVRQGASHTPTLRWEPDELNVDTA